MGKSPLLDECLMNSEPSEPPPLLTTGKSCGKLWKFVKARDSKSSQVSHHFRYWNDFKRL